MTATRRIACLCAALGAVAILMLGGCKKPAPQASGAQPGLPPARSKLIAVTGHVRVAGQPAHQGTMVYIPGTPHFCVTDLDGRFVLDDLSAGQTYMLHAQRFGMEDTQLTSFTLAEDAVSPVALETWLIEPDMALSASELGGFRGVAMLQDQDSHEGVMVSVYDQKGRVVTRLATMRDGSYRSINMLPGRYMLRFSRRGYLNEQRELEVREGMIETGPALMLARSGENGGDEVESAESDDGLRTVTGRLALLGGDASPEAMGKAIIGLENTQYAEHPDAAGNFTLTGIEPGEYALLAWAPGYIASQPFRLDLSQRSAMGLEITLKPEQEQADGPGKIFGSVLLSDNPSNLSGIIVGLLGTSYTSLTDTGGKFRFDNVPAGQYAMNFQLAGYQTLQLTNLALEAGEALELEPVTLERIFDRPRVMTTSPGNGERDVLLTERVPVLVRFSKKMQPDSVLNSITIQPDVSFRAYIGKQHEQSDFDLLYIELYGGASARPPLEFNQRYLVTIGKEAADFDGLGMEEDYAFGFFMSGPAVISSWPASDSAQAVLDESDSALRIYFNCKVDPDTLREGMFDIRPHVRVKPRIEISIHPGTGWTVCRLHTHWEEDTSYTVRLDRRIRSDAGRMLEGLPLTLNFRTAKYYSGAQEE
ncbi:carboxypeptidase regulatory-like domain-containing protein [Candidatus Sumerlaeota bacterium]|nr:carboxypeptidase regulatory-like domain-containing protein [Candidatus Sumerlaeota bacterium]